MSSEVGFAHVDLSGLGNQGCFQGGEQAEALRLFLELVCGDFILNDAFVFECACGFGSATELNVAVVLNRCSRSNDDLIFDLADITYQVMERTGVAIAPVPFLQSEWSQGGRHADQQLIQFIVSEGTRVFSRTDRIAQNAQPKLASAS